MTSEIRRVAYARAGLIGNPSDGYNGKTIAFSIKNYSAEVVLQESSQLKIVATQRDENSYADIHALHKDIVLHGYYGGIRLIKATIKAFVDYCQLTGQSLKTGNFTVTYDSNIPQQVGLAGSSGIIVATLRALMAFYEVDIDQRVQPSLVFSVEHKELGIGGGLQDRVIQIYEGVVAMDFSEDAMTTLDGFEVGQYTKIDTGLLPLLYIAFRPASSEPTEVFHNNLRERYDAGDTVIVNAMQEFAALTDRAVEALHTGDASAFARCVDANFDLRQSMCELNPAHVEMIRVARRAGATAKYAGSGGATVGTYKDQAEFEVLESAMRAIGCEVLKPVI